MDVYLKYDIHSVYGNKNTRHLKLWLCILEIMNWTYPYDAFVLYHKFLPYMYIHIIIIRKDNYKAKYVDFVFSIHSLKLDSLHEALQLSSSQF